MYGCGKRPFQWYPEIENTIKILKYFQFHENRMKKTENMYWKNCTRIENNSRSRKQFPKLFQCRAEVKAYFYYIQ